jgi:hypothetical protein
MTQIDYRPTLDTFFTAITEMMHGLWDTNKLGPVMNSFGQSWS